MYIRVKILWGFHDFKIVLLQQISSYPLIIFVGPYIFPLKNVILILNKIVSNLSTRSTLGFAHYDTPRT